MEEEKVTIASRVHGALSVIGNPKKDGENEHFRSSYATLNSVLAVVKPALAENGLVLRQEMACADGDKLNLVTKVCDRDGAVMVLDSRFVPYNPDPQRAGSYETYMRRYALMTAFGIAAEDDDGEAAAGGAPDAKKLERIRSGISTLAEVTGKGEEEVEAMVEAKFGSIASMCAADADRVFAWLVKRYKDASGARS